MPFQFSNGAGTPIGAMTHDGSYFADVTATLPTTTGLFLVLSTPLAPTGAGLTWTFLRLNGRADTAYLFLPYVKYAALRFLKRELSPSP